MSVDLIFDTTLRPLVTAERTGRIIIDVQIVLHCCD